MKFSGKIHKFDDDDDYNDLPSKADSNALQKEKQQQQQ